MTPLDYVFAAVFLVLIVGGFLAYRKYRAKKPPATGGGYGGGGPKQPPKQQQ